MQLWPAGGAALLCPCCSWTRWRSSTGAAGRPDCREVESSQTHPHVSHRCLRSHWVPGWRTQQQGYGTWRPRSDECVCERRVTDQVPTVLLLLLSTSECPTTPGLSPCCSWCWRSGSWSCPRYSSLCTVVSRTLTSPLNWSRCLGKDWSKLQSPPGLGSTPGESAQVWT